MDGERTADGIVAKLRGSFPAEEAWYAILTLQEKGCLTEGSGTGEANPVMDRLRPLVENGIVKSLRSVPGNVIPSAAFEALVDCGSRTVMARGKGVTEGPALLSCLAEAAERYCLIAAGFEDSNGCAAGETVQDATHRGLMELIERDAASAWWSNRRRCRAVDLSTFHDTFLTMAQSSVCVLDLTSALGVPVFAAVAPGVDGSALLGLGADLDARTGITQAITELNQVAGAGVVLQARYEVHPQLSPNGRAKTADDYRQAVKFVLARPMNVRDLSLPEIGFPVVRVTVEGMCGLGDDFPL